MATANTTTTGEVQRPPEQCDVSPSKRTFTICAQNIGSGAKVHNGDNYYLTRRATTFDRRRPAIVKWLSPLNFDGAHERIHYEASVADQSELSRKEQYAGKWLLESEKFDAWRTGKLRKLWYFGMPGAGKTVLASIIIEHLRELQANLKQTAERPMIAFLYLSYKNIHTIEQLLGSVIRQLLQNEEPLPQPVTKLWTRRNQGDDPATVKDLTELLKALVQNRQGYIVIDALDECSADYRLRLIQVLEAESENLSLLVTSRLLDDFDDISKGFHNIPIRADLYDLDLFIDHEIETRSRLKKFSEQDSTLRGEIKEAVRKACDGMFLLASLQMRSLVAELSIRGVREKLNNFPKNIKDMYADTLKRIENLEQNKQKLAMDTLAWIVCSCRPLKIGELQHALAVIPNSSTLHFDQIYQEDDIRDVCGGLVTIVNGVVSLVHYTAQSYFDHNRFPGFDSVIAQSCITYLSLTVLEQPDDEENKISYADDIYHVPDDRSAAEVLRAYQSGSSSAERLSFENKRNVFPFVDYAAPHLRHHLSQIEAGSEISSGFIPSLARLLQDRSKRNYFLRMLGEHDLPRPYSYHRLARVALGSNVPSDANQDASETEDKEDEKCTWEDRADTVIKFLLDDSDFDTDAESESDYDSDFTPSGPSSRRTNHDKFTALHLAAFLGWSPIMQALLNLPEQLADVNTVDPWGRTPITMAANEGNWDVVPILLSHGASVDILSDEYCYILLHAAQTGRKDVFEMLISQARGPLTLKPSDVAFMVTVMSAASDVIVLLFMFFKAVFSAWNQKPEPSLDKVSTTQEKEQQPTTDNLGNHLQLVEASMLGNMEILNNLIQDAKVDFKNQHSVFHLMALFSAVEFNQPVAVQALLDAGADVNMLDFGGSTPLHRAVSRNHISVVKTLLTAKPNVELKNDDGQTPWSSSLDREHREVLELLRRAGADPNARGPQGISRLYSAAACGDLDTVLFLIECGVDPSIRTNYGWAPLHWAAHNGHLPCVRALIEAGADINPMSDTSATPLDKAREANQTVIERVLLDAGAKSSADVFADKESRAARSESDCEDNGDDDDSVSDDDKSDYNESSDSDDDEDGEEEEWLHKMLDVVQRAEAREDLKPKQRAKIQRAVLAYLTEWEEEEEGGKEEEEEEQGDDKEGEGEGGSTALPPSNLAIKLTESHESCNEEQDENPGNRNEETDNPGEENLEDLDQKGDQMTFEDLKAQLNERIKKVQGRKEKNKKSELE